MHKALASISYWDHITGECVSGKHKGYQLEILHSHQILTLNTDGGITWTVQSSSQEFGLIHAIDENNLIAGKDATFSFAEDIYKSSDDGDNWM
ncbi:MAG: hypothetical protein AB8G15_10675 [Saprospiraceae bacterium]